MLEPTFEWTAHQRNMLEDQLNTVTTPMYRAPEMLDTWSNYPIGPKADIWALGCILYFLCYQKHPFEDGGKLRIINANYIMPPDSRYNCFREIIKGCFKVNPAERYDISMVLERLAAIAETNNWSLKGPLDLRGMPIETSPAHSPERSMPETSHSEFYCDNPNPAAMPTPTPMSTNAPQTAPAATTSTVNHASGSLLSSLRGGAGTLFKNLKDTSTKVMQTMQQSIARNDLDISHITSRVLVMPCPSDGFESTYKTNNIEDVRMSLESRFAPQKISIYNFGPRTVPRLPPPVRTVEAGSVYGCPQAHAPNLQVSAKTSIYITKTFSLTTKLYFRACSLCQRICITSLTQIPNLLSLCKLAIRAAAQRPQLYALCLCTQICCRNQRMRCKCLLLNATPLICAPPSFDISTILVIFCGPRRYFHTTRISTWFRSAVSPCRA